jgi:hypothetical protein
MLFFHQQNNSRGLGVEGRGRVENDMVDYLLDFGVGDGALFLERVDGAAVFDGLE